MEQGDPEALGAAGVSTRPWVPQRGLRQCRRRGREVCSQRGARRSTHSLLPGRPPGGSAGVCGETGTSRLPVSRGGIILWPFQHRRGEVHIQRASSPPPQRPQGQGSRRVQGRGEAAALGLARGEAAVLPLPPALRAPDFPSRHGLSPLRVSPPATRCCSPCWCFSQNH